MCYRLFFLIALASPLGCVIEDAAPTEDLGLAPAASDGAVASSSPNNVLCHVFNDGYTAIAGPSDAIYIRDGSQACIPDGTATGTCRKWFGRCFLSAQHNVKVYFRVFADGYANQSIESDAVYIHSALQACIPDGSAEGACRKWFGRAFTRQGAATSPVQFNIFGDGYTFQVGPYDAIFWNGSELCVPDGTAHGTCRKWFGRGVQ